VGTTDAEELLAKVLGADLVALGELEGDGGASEDDGDILPALERLYLLQRGHVGADPLEVAVLDAGGRDGRLLVHAEGLEGTELDLVVLEGRLEGLETVASGGRAIELTGGGENPVGGLALLEPFELFAERRHCD